MICVRLQRYIAMGLCSMLCLLLEFHNSAFWQLPGEFQGRTCATSASTEATSLFFGLYLILTNRYPVLESIFDMRGKVTTQRSCRQFLCRLRYWSRTHRDRRSLWLYCWLWNIREYHVDFRTLHHCRGDPVVVVRTKRTSIRLYCIQSKQVLGTAHWITRYTVSDWYCTDLKVDRPLCSLTFGLAFVRQPEQER